MNNLQLTGSPLTHEFRLMKQVNSLLKNKIVNKIYLAGLHEQGLKEEENFNEFINVKRFSLWTRSWSRFFFVQFLKVVELYIKVIFYYRKKEIHLINVHVLALLPLGVFLKYFHKAFLVYDPHEFETELYGKPYQRFFKKIIERFFIRFVDQTFVVGEKIADEYEKMYKKRPVVIMNCPPFQTPEKTKYWHEKFSIPDHHKIFLYQGKMANGRGIDLILRTAEKAHHLELSVSFVFLGYGYREKDIINNPCFHKNVFFHPAVNNEELLNYTAAADIGLCLIEDFCKSYFYSMPNKLFETVMARIPVIVSNLIEMASFVKKNNIGFILKEPTEEGFLEIINQVLSENFKKNDDIFDKVIQDYSWESQEIKMVQSYHKMLLNK
jgi:glycosyltransferase involved in cell wall biosynthesis